MKTRALTLTAAVLLAYACSTSPTEVPSADLGAPEVRFDHTFGSGNITGGSGETDTGTKTAADSSEETAAVAETTTLRSGQPFGSGN